MMKRATWFVAGAATGAAGAVAATRKVKRTVAQMAPSNVARKGVDAAKAQVHRVTDAVRDGRSAMADRELELRERLGLPTPPDDDDTVIDVTERLTVRTSLPGASRRSKR